MEILKSPGIETAIKKGGFSLEIGGMSELELEHALTKRPFSLRDYARGMMQSLDFGTFAISRKIRVALVTLGDLGFIGYPPTDQIFEQTPKLGLELLPAEAGPYARLHDRDQRREDWYCIAMNPIADRYGDPRIFALARDGDALVLNSDWTGHGRHWNLDAPFLFGVRK